jgi:hypothetical protein
MGTRRDLLHTNHVPDFKRWLELNGWTIQKPKGIYEIIRATKPNHNPVIFYQRDSAHSRQGHLTTFGQGTKLVFEFLAVRRSSKNSILVFNPIGGQ